MDRDDYGRGNAGAARGRGRGGGGDGGDGRGRGRGRGGRGNYQNQQPQYHQGQYQQVRGYPQQQGGGGGRGRGRGWGPNQPANNPPPPANRGGYRPSGGEYRPPAMGPWAGSVRPVSGGVGVGGRGGAWGPPVSDRTWVQTPPPQQQLPDLSQSNLTVGEKQPLLTLEDVGKNKVVSMKRPDRGGAHAVRWFPLLVNHFPVRFDQNTIIRHYDVDIKQEVSSKDRIVKKPVQKSELRSIREKLFADDPTRFPLQKTAYDGEKNIFSAVPLPSGHFKVELSDGEGEDRKCRSYVFTIQLVNEVRLSKLKSYLNAEVMDIPREILQSMDLVMKENPSRHRITFGRSSYPREYRRGDDLRCGVAAFRGFQQSLKPTSQGLAMCLDYSVMALRKRMPVIDYLKENVPGFRGVHDVWLMIGDVTKALKGLKVTVIHRITKQKYTVAGLTKVSARELSFDLEDPEGKDPPMKVGLLSYFLEKYHKDIEYKDIPCLDVGKNKRKNYLPMEFAVLAEGQRYQKDQLSKVSNTALPLFRNISMPPPKERKETICEMVRSNDGPCGGEFIGNFDLEVVKDMTKVPGRVIGPPTVMLGNRKKAAIRMDRCQWNLLNDSVVEGKAVERWALIDFSSTVGRSRLKGDIFVEGLVNKCVKLGVHMDYPLFHLETDMNQLHNVGTVRKLLDHVIVEASKNSDGGDGLQLIVCVMTERAPGYKYLKWVSETQIGVLTQCCLASTANKDKGRDQFYANMALKINAKLGGVNFELMDRLPRFEGGDHVMFIGADVNHPAPFNASSPSIAAVVATVGWPSINKYAARVCPQEHRKEKIVSFGSICLDLVNTYARFNGVKPKKIVVFRDGVSEGQFDMVLNEELIDLKRAIYEEYYQPTITLVVAQKRHQTRLFLENERDGVQPGNVPPGTVVDTIIVHPFEFDFYLCSHFGGIGTSKPTHYYVLWDENGFTSDQLQKLIYDLCFTFARCTKPVSLVPPVYYADLVAYRGRMFQEVAMEMQPPPSASSSSSVVSSSSTNSFDETFYRLHSDLENIMFFV